MKKNEETRRHLLQGHLSYSFLPHHTFKAAVRFDCAKYRGKNFSFSHEAFLSSFFPSPFVYFFPYSLYYCYYYCNINYYPSDRYIHIPCIWQSSRSTTVNGIMSLSPLLYTFHSSTLTLHVLKYFTPHKPLIQQHYRYPHLSHHIMITLSFDNPPMWCKMAIFPSATLLSPK